jgi:hypothetical protein
MNVDITTTKAQQGYFATIYNIRTRPIAMGGAFTSVEDDLPAVLYNPGAFTMYKNRKSFRLTFFMNPLASYLAFYQDSERFRNSIHERDVLLNASLLFKGIVLTSRSFNLGVILGEESIETIRMKESPRFFNYNDLWENCAHTAFVNVDLARRVSIGISVTNYESHIKSLKATRYGFSYGILLKPGERVNVGLSYVDFPEKNATFRLPIERLMDETMNIGISYRPFDSTILSADVRNLSEENKANVREVHLGFEQQIVGITALRMGFFRERFTRNVRYSAGVGLLDSNLISREKDQFNHRQFICNYSFVYEDDVTTFNRWHFLSLIYRF